ncbi:unnamed protein product [Periconia digitata]|uniref:Uncharacterized protein n=1 Tax=Periconia digitata TaxID=1303443 RepID=A0A9W4XRU5_9PLEO|nr:unnamed protein product [Periconia digitata]
MRYVNTYTYTHTHTYIYIYIYIYIDFHRCNTATALRQPQHSIQPAKPPYPQHSSAPLSAMRQVSLTIYPPSIYLCGLNCC